jgi:glucose/arabinose dehydrogenase
MRPTFVVTLGLVAVLAAACGSGSDSATATTTAPASTAPAKAAARGVRLVRVGSFQNPLYVTSPPGDRRRVFVVEQNGKVMVMRDGRKLATPFLDIGSKIVAGGEQGLLGLAFAPDYATSKRFYVYYTAAGGGADTLAEYRATSAEAADPSSGRVLFSLPDPESNHNGGQLAFGPDRLLYVGIGDGGGGNDQHGSRGNAQNLGSLFGKILRIDPRASGGQPYTVPKTNPFVGRSGARGEIYSYGLRNPWRFSFDRANGMLTIGDVGQNAIEEVDAVARGRGRGANFGWRPFEGTHRIFDEPAPGAIPPVLEHTHDQGWCSVTGGYVVRDRGVPALYGRYLYGDYCMGQLWSARVTGGKATGDRRVPGLAQVSQLSSFGEDGRGRVYATSLDGPVYRLASR